MFQITELLGIRFTITRKNDFKFTKKQISGIFAYITEYRTLQGRGISKF